MADIDMIPRSYRDALRVRRLLHGYGLALAALLLAALLAAGLLHWRLALATPRLEQLRTRTAQGEALRARVAGALARNSDLAQDAQALAALRGSGAIASLAGALDAALNDKVWFDTLHFARTEELLHAPLPSPLPAGTLETRAANKAGSAPGPQTWRLARRVEIRGQALNHAALAAFLTTLSASPTLADVRFLKSSAASGDGPELVAFSVSAVASQPGARR
jgi:Tfp pilus assembly protein PilN